MKRRALLKCIPAGAAAVLASANLPAQTAHSATDDGDQKITVLNPAITEKPAERVPLTARLNTLEGKTIYFINDGFPGSDNVLHEMMDWFKTNYPKTTLEYRYKGMGEAGAPPLWKEMIEKADAMILGVGH